MKVCRLNSSVIIKEIDKVRVQYREIIISSHNMLMKLFTKMVAHD